jgi:hypothetical protein
VIGCFDGDDDFLNLVFFNNSAQIFQFSESRQMVFQRLRPAVGINKTQNLFPSPFSYC